MVPGIHLILGTMFINNGVRVHYSDIDNDDTLASYAQFYGASILSKDKDFLRYRNSTYTIFEDFEVRGDKLHLKKRNT